MTDLTQQIAHREGSIEIFTTNQITFKHKGDKIVLRGPVHALVRYVRPNGKDKGSEEVILRASGDLKEIVCQESPQDQYDCIITDMGAVPPQPTLLDLIADQKHIDVRTTGNLIGYHPNDMVRLKGPGRFRVEYKGKSGATRRAEDVVLNSPGEVRDFINKSGEEDLWVSGSYTGAAVTAPAPGMPAPTGAFPDGTLLKTATSGNIYVMEGGHKRHVTSPEVMAKYGYDWNAIRTISDPEINNIPTGAPKS